MALHLEDRSIAFGTIIKIVGFFSLCLKFIDGPINHLK
jgi:hypothetical protein